MPEHLAGKKNYFVEKIFKSFSAYEVIKAGVKETHPYWLSNQTKIPSFSKRLDKNILPKLHTLREDKNDKWEAGNDIHFWINFRTKNQLQFAPLIKVTSVQSIVIKNDGGKLSKLVSVKVDGKELFPFQVKKLAINDGFPDLESFFCWFDKDFKGKIIHWTELRY